MSIYTGHGGVRNMSYNKWCSKTIERPSRDAHRTAELVESCSLTINRPGQPLSSSRGVIINVASILGLLGSSAETPAAAYSSTKHAVMGLTKTVRLVSEVVHHLQATGLVYL